MFKIFLLITCAWCVCGQDIPIVPLPTNPPRTTTTTTTTTPATTTTIASTTRSTPFVTPSTTRGPFTTTRWATTTKITTLRPIFPSTTKGYPCREQNCFYYKLFLNAYSFHCKRCCTLYNKKHVKCFFVPNYKCGQNTFSRSHSGHYHHLNTKY